LQRESIDFKKTSLIRGIVETVSADKASFRFNQDWWLVDHDVVAGWPIVLTKDIDSIIFILGGNVLAVPERNSVMVRGAVGSPEEDGTSRRVGHVIVVGSQGRLLGSGPGTQTEGVLDQARAVEARE